MGNVIQAKTFQLQAPIGSTDTTIAVKNLETIYGDDVVMSGSIQYSTLEPESQSNQEIISFTGITAVSTNVWNLTGVTRGLDAQPTAGVYGNNPAQGKAHASSVDCILSDSPQVWDDKVSKSEDETVTGLITFSQSPLVPTPDSTFEAANKDYVDNVVAAGAADASTTTAGISRLSASPNVTIGTCTMTIASPCVVSFTSHGLTLNDSIQFTTTGALPTGVLASTTYYVISAGLTANAFQIATTRGGTAINTTGSQSGTHTLIKTTPVAIGSNDTTIVTKSYLQSGAATYGTDSGGDDTYVVALTPALTAYTTGQTLYAKMTTANTGACTIDFGPGAKSVKMIDGTDPLDGDIASGKVQYYVYDGTNLILQNPAVTPASKAYVNTQITASTSSYVSALTTVTASTTTNTDTTITCGFTPKTITVYYNITGSSSGAARFSQGVAIYNSSGTLSANQALFTNKAAAITVTTSFPTFDTTAPYAGDASGTYIIPTLTINSVSSTGLVLRTAFTQSGGPTGTANFVVEVTK